MAGRAAHRFLEQSDRLGGSLRHEPPCHRNRVVRRDRHRGDFASLPLCDEPDGGAGDPAVHRHITGRPVRRGNRLQPGHQRLGRQPCDILQSAVLWRHAVQPPAEHLEHVVGVQRRLDVLWRHGLQPAPRQLERVEHPHVLLDVPWRHGLQSAAEHVDSPHDARWQREPRRDGHDVPERRGVQSVAEYLGH